VSGLLRSIGLHGTLAVTALAFLLFVTASQSEYLNADISSLDTVDIAVEHKDPLSLRVQMSERAGQALIVIEQEGTENISVSVPAAWKRGEVRNASLDAISAEAPMLGFVRWQLPGSSSVTFSILDAPSRLLLHNPTKVPLKVSFMRVNLETDEVEQNVILVKDEAVILE